MPSPLYKSNTLLVATCGTLDENDAIWLAHRHTCKWSLSNENMKNKDN